MTGPHAGSGAGVEKCADRKLADRVGLRLRDTTVTVVQESIAGGPSKTYFAWNVLVSGFRRARQLSKARRNDPRPRDIDSGLRQASPSAGRNVSGS